MSSADKASALALPTQRKLTRLQIPWDPCSARRLLLMVTATVREWHDEEGWGVLNCPDTPGGCWGHFSAVETEGFRSLAPGQRVALQWEAPGFKQDGYDYRAVRIVP
jgi:cold shock protein